MKNLDTIKAEKQKFIDDLKKSFDDKDGNGFVKAIQNLSQKIEEEIMQVYEQYATTGDSSILAQRGVRQLTQAENKFYDNLKQVMTSANPKMQISNLDLTIPQTIIDTIIEDIKSSHQLLNTIKITNTNGKVKWLYAEDPQQLAQWGKITGSLIGEMSGTIKEVDFSLSKITAILTVPKDLLELGANYIDAFVRKILSDALASGLEYGFLYGTGKISGTDNQQPIGMTRKVTGDTSGVYPAKTKQALTNLDITSYTALISQLSERVVTGEDKTPKYRSVGVVDLIVNPADYISKILPATTVQGTDGTYKNNIFPYPTRVIQSDMVKKGEAVIGLIDEYIALFSSGANGSIQYSDEALFVEDQRIYTVKNFAYGRAKDDNCFVYVDISNLKPASIKVTTVTEVSEVTE